jgi:aconitase B
MVFVAIIAYCTIMAVGLSAVWIFMHHDPKQYKKLTDMDNQRRALAKKIIEEHANSDWWTQRKFKSHIRKGGTSL